MQFSKFIHFNLETRKKDDSSDNFKRCLRISTEDYCESQRKQTRNKTPKKDEVEYASLVNVK